MLHTGEQPDVSGAAQWNCLHQNPLLCHHWSSMGPPLRAVPRPATPLQKRLHPQHPHWSLSRSDRRTSKIVFDNDEVGNTNYTYSHSDTMINTITSSVINSAACWLVFSYYGFKQQKHDFSSLQFVHIWCILSLSHNSEKCASAKVKQ